MSMLKKAPFLIFFASLLFAGTSCTGLTQEAKGKVPSGRKSSIVKASPGVKPKTAAPVVKKKVPMPALSSPKSWSIVVIPDIQTYVKQIENQGILDMMLAWIVRRRDEMNIRQVLFTGDLVYSNDQGMPVQPAGVRFAPSGSLRDLIGDEQWQATSRLLTRLDGIVPYVLSTGNHDYGINNAENRNSHFSRFFPINRNPLTCRQLVSCHVNAFGKRTLENSAYELIAPGHDGRKFLIITLQFAPTDKDLKWAEGIAGQPRFANHIGILLTHSYMYANGKRIQKENYVLNRKGGNAGEAIFRKLVYPAKNIRLVIAGHVCRINNWNYAVGFSVDKNSSGKKVSQMVFNTQAIGGGFSGNGGDGWLRILEFLPDGKSIKASTFSPFFYSSPSTQFLAWKKDARNEFTFTLD